MGTHDGPSPEQLDQCPPTGGIELSWAQAQRYVEQSFDPTVLLHQLRRRDLFRFSISSNNTSVVDQDQLIAAAREEIRRAKRREKMPDQGKLELAGELLDLEPGEADFPQRLARLMRDAGVTPATVTIEYRGLGVEADALVGEGSTPTLGNAFMDLLKKATLQGGLKRQPYGILKDLSGVLRPGTITLLLGPPGAGKTVFLQALSGRLKLGRHLRMSGSIKYNGVEASEFVLARTVALVEQIDYHIPNLTVLETCQFAFQCLDNVQNAAFFLAQMDRVLERLDREQALVDLDEAAEQAEEGQAGKTEGDGAEEAAAKRSKSKQAVCNTYGHGLYDQEFVRQMRDVIKQRAKVHIVLKILGLSDVADTIVGDSMTRGISGGQRKRVTTGEILSGPQSVLLMDEISTGLDSATTYSVIRSFVASAHAMGRTTVISLLQPAPEVVNLFDEVLLLTDGRVMYHGPVSEILPFFERQLDFVCPVRKDIGSFLQEVTTPVGQYAYAGPALLARRGLTEADRDPLKLVTAPPKDLLTPVEEIESTFWKQTQWGQETLDRLANHPFNPADGKPHALHKTRYASSWLRLTGLVLQRQFRLNQRDRAFYVARAMQALILALIMASLWATISPSAQEGRQVMSLSSLSVQFMIIMSTPQIGLVFANKRVFYKQRDNHFFPAASYVGSLLLTQLPQSFIEVTVFSLLLYWISGLTRSAGNFFLFWLVLYSISNCMAGFYRLLAYSVKSMIVANASGALSLLFLMITNGFSIVRGSIPVYLIWVYWINPISWAVRALVSNELNSYRWQSQPSPTPDVPLGTFCADQFDFYLGSRWVWGSVGVSWAALVVFTAAGVAAMTLSNPPSPKPTVPEEEQKQEVKRGVFAGLLQRESLALQAAGSGLSLALHAAGSGLSLASSGRLAARPKPAGASSVPNDANGATPALVPAGSGAGEGELELERALSRLEVVGQAAGERRERMVVPFTPITLVCRNIRYYVDDPSKGAAPGVVKDTSDKEIAGKLELLKGIDFYAEPGSLTALMGGSGAGKTTLMDCILGRKTTGLIRGDIFVNGHPKVQATWSRVCGYVEQQDVHSAGATVREALVFSARLRLTEDITMEQVLQVVDDTLEMVDLTALQGSIVGDPGGEGLSVEQRKRLSIAVELVANPSVVFMDEPTSGLDARAAAIVMRAVKNVSLSNRTVVVTIHQPSMEIFEAFDHLVLLQRGGRLTYFGPLGVESADLIAYLEGQPGVEPIQAGYNPATWMLEVTGGSMSTVFKNSGLDFPAIYAGSTLCRDNEARMGQLVEEGQKSSKPLSLSTAYATSTATQMRVITHKWFLLYWRNPNYNFVRFAMTICIALILGLVYLNQGRLGDSGDTVDVSTVQNIMGLIFVLTVFLGMFNAMTVQPVVAAERLVFYRERSSSYYAALPYAAASGVVEIPYLVVQAVLMVVISYWMAGFQALAWKFFYFLLTYWCSLAMFTFFGQFLVFSTPNQLLAQLLSGFVNQLWSIFAGFMVPYPAMPAGWKWMNRLSPTTWTLWGLVGSQLCDRDDVQMTGFGGQTISVSVFMEEAFGYTFDMVWWCTLIVFAYCIFFRLSSTLLLRFVNFQRR
ncbi:hypothetical protein ABPG77_011385 [Micractinium sp. CCAP 211/92]